MVVAIALLTLAASGFMFAEFRKLNDSRGDLWSMVLVSGGLVGLGVALGLQAIWPMLVTWTSVGSLLATGAVLYGVVYRRRHELPRTEELEEENTRYRSVIRGLQQGLLLFDSDGHVLECNAEAERILGLRFDQIEGRQLEDLDMSLLREDGSKLPLRRHPAIIALRSGRSVPATTVGIRHSKETLWLSMQAQPLADEHSGDVATVAAYFIDITHEKGRERRLYRLATEDPLTGLQNRRALEEHLRSREGMGNRGGAVLVLDLDNFKVINDILGHASGDEALIRIARLFQSCVRPHDVVARLGGDEFVILLKNVSYDEAYGIANRIREAVATFEYRVGGHRFHLGVSIGLTMVDEELEPRALLMLADTALQEAKRSGKDQVVVHRHTDPEGARISDFNRWASRIKDALSHNRFELHFQPIVALVDESVCSFEALIRMRSKTGNLFPPEPFLSTAEYFNLMPEIDRWVVGRVMEVLLRNPEWKVFVNLSGSSLNNESLLDYIRDSIVEHELEPGRLVFEVTETIAVANMGRVTKWIDEMRKYGCQFALDDFGSGFSSFTYLHSLPIDFVKIDGSYVSKMDTDPTCRSIVQSITGVCHAMGKKVIAEWVENARIVSLLKSLGVEYGQGYHWGQPKAGVLPEIRSCLSDQCRDKLTV